MEKLAKKTGVIDTAGEITWIVDNFTDAGTEYWDDGSGDPTKLN